LPSIWAIGLPSLPCGCKEMTAKKGRRKVRNQSTKLKVCNTYRHKLRVPRQEELVKGGKKQGKIMRLLKLPRLH
jgi:hypothetical protein